MKYDVNTIINKYDNEESLDFLFFWGHHGKPDRLTKACLSQWYPSTFEVEMVTYNCAEQYMMAEKARTFKDYEMCDKIMKSSTPKEIKTLGRQVRNFDENRWATVSKNKVSYGNFQKFGQNRELLQFLLATGDKVIVEASPYDTIWGIGMSERDEGVDNPHNWKGSNLLGFALMEVRDTLKVINDYAKQGEKCDVMRALTLLTRAYLDMCGISLGYRTVVYCAAEAWLERLAWQDLPLSEMARKEPLVELMPHITSDYVPELYDEYDITGMGNDELLRLCFFILRSEEFDEETLEVLCWGILKVTEVEKELSRNIEVTASDGTLLKGVLTGQKCCHTYVTMTSPFNLHSAKFELVRDARELLLRAYDDYHRLQHMENEIRELYPKYREKLKDVGDASAYKKYLVYEDVYGELLDDILIFPKQELIKEWFGLDIEM